MTELTYDGAVNEIRRLQLLLREYSLGKEGMPSDLSYRDAVRRLQYLRNRIPKLRKKWQQATQE